MNSLRYYADFLSIDNTEWRLRIYKDGYSGYAERIELEDDPITIEYSQNDIFKPSKLSGATIKVLTPHILEDLYTGTITDVRIEIYKEEDLFWVGYNSPNIYNSEWLTDYDSTEINAIDTLSALQYMKYETGLCKSRMIISANLFHTPLNYTADPNNDNVQIIGLNLSDDEENLIFKFYINGHGEQQFSFLYGNMEDYAKLFTRQYQSLGLIAEWSNGNLIIKSTKREFEHSKINDTIEVSFDDTNEYETKNFLNIITKALNLVRGNLKYLIYSNTLGNLSLSDYVVNERTFFDEEEEPITQLQVIEHICQFLGCTIVQDKDTYKILEIGRCGNGEDFDYNKYNLDTLEKEDGIDDYKVIKAEVWSENASVSLGDVYNQINVLGNMLEMEDNPIDVFGKDDDLTLISDKYQMNLLEVKEDDEYAGVQGSMNMYAYYKKRNCMFDIPDNIDRDTYFSTDAFNTSKGIMVREASVDADTVEYGLANIWHQDDASSSLDFTQYFAYKFNRTEQYLKPLDNLNEQTEFAYNPSIDKPILSITSEKDVVYSKGDYLILSMTFRPSVVPCWSTNYPTEITPITSQFLDWQQNMGRKFKNISPKTNKWSDGYSGNIQRFAFIYKLQIGDYYFNGTSWTTTESTFMVESAARAEVCGEYISGGIIGAGYFIPYSNADWSGDWHLRNTNSYKVRTKDNSSGKLIYIDKNLVGKVKLTIYDCIGRPGYNSEFTGSTGTYTDDEADYKYMLINDLKITHTLKENGDFYDIIEDGENEDLKYSAIIDSNNITEFEDITLYLNTYNPSLCHKLSYSYVLDKNNNYIMNLMKDGFNIRPEEHLVRMYVNHYSQPKIIYSNILKDKGFKPISSVYVESLDRKLIIGDISYNLQNESVDIKAYEL